MATATPKKSTPAKRSKPIVVKTAKKGTVIRRALKKAVRPEDLVGQILIGEKFEPGTVISVVRNGLPFSSIERMQESLGDAEHVLRVVGMSSRTFHRRKQDRQALDPMTSDRLYRLAKVEAQAIQVLGDQAAAIDWLKTPNRALGDSPLKLLDTEAGADQVLRVLGRIEHGVYS